MKTRSRSLIAFAVIAGTACAVSRPTLAQTQYKIDYLISPYKANISDSWLFGINNQGQATGYTITRTDTGSFARNVVIYKDGITQVLASGSRGNGATGLAINDRGDVAGGISFVPTYFPASGPATTINTPGMNYNFIWGLNNTGTVLVNGWNTDVPQGFTENFQLWNNGTSRPLNALNALYPYTLGPDPNDPYSGKVAYSYSFANTNLARGNQFAAGVDYSTYDPQDPDNPDDDLFTDSFSAYVFDGVDNYHLLTPPTPGDLLRPINTLDDGSVFGWAGNHLARWNPDGSLNQILPDYAGGLRPYGYAGFSSVQTNSLGQIVAITSTQGIAFYDPQTGAWSDISSSISGLGTGIFDSIQGFNDAGQFVGLARPPLGNGGTYGYVVTAVPEPGSLAFLLSVAGVGGFAALKCRKHRGRIV